MILQSHMEANSGNKGSKESIAKVYYTSSETHN